MVEFVLKALLSKIWRQCRFARKIDSGFFEASFRLNLEELSLWLKGLDGRGISANSWEIAVKFFELHLFFTVARSFELKGEISALVL